MTRRPQWQLEGFPKTSAAEMEHTRMSVVTAEEDDMGSRREVHSRHWHLMLMLKYLLTLR